MPAVGNRDDYVDTQDVSLIVTVIEIENEIPKNVDKIFTQLMNVKINRTFDFTTHYLTNDTVERIAGLEIPSIEGDIVLTQIQLDLWNSFFEVDSQGLLPKHLWKATFTDQNNLTGNFTLINGKVLQFYTIDSGIGSSTHHFVIEGEKMTSSAATE